MRLLGLGMVARAEALLSYSLLGVESSPKVSSFLSCKQQSKEHNTPLDACCACSCVEVGYTAALHCTALSAARRQLQRLNLLCSSTATLQPGPGAVPLELLFGNTGTAFRKSSATAKSQCGST
jgi:hypothetical protein